MANEYIEYAEMWDRVRSRAADSLGEGSCPACGETDEDVRAECLKRMVNRAWWRMVLRDGLGCLVFVIVIAVVLGIGVKWARGQVPPLEKGRADTMEAFNKAQRDRDGVVAPSSTERVKAYYTPGSPKSFVLVQGVITGKDDSKVGLKRLVFNNREQAIGWASARECRLVWTVVTPQMEAYIRKGQLDQLERLQPDRRVSKYHNPKGK